MNTCDCEYKTVARKAYQGRWAYDNKCYNCDRYFTTFKRRHHCRYCGESVCSSCCGMKYVYGNRVRYCCRCSENMHHGQSYWCQLYDKFLMTQKPQLKYDDVDVFDGKRFLYWVYQCPKVAGKKHEFYVGDGVIRDDMVTEANYTCLGHWLNEKTDGQNN